jgi:dGTPase
VSQIGRTVARALRLNEDLVEALALSHDLGHTPFGHVGEDVLGELMAGQGGFEHNRQTLRIVERLEERYPDFPGLNLTWEVREGIAKHSGPIDVAAAPEYAEYAPEEQPPLEVQLIDLVDEIAYNHHDIDDGLESGILEIGALGEEVPLFGDPFRAARQRYPGAELRQWRKLALHGVVTRLVDDLIAATGASVGESGVASLEEVRAAGRQLVRLSPEVAAANRVLKVFLRERLYRHPRIERMREEARRILRALYTGYLENPHRLPEETRRRAGEEGLPRTVADYVAGMTDRYAHEEYRRLHDPGVRA